MEFAQIVLSGGITIISLILLLVALHSYRTIGNKKLLFVFGVFVFFFIKGLLLSAGLFYTPLAFLVTGYYLWVVDIIVLTLLYVSALKS